jgi:hypothetical protein
MTTTPRLMIREQRDAIVNLFLSDQETKGRPVLRAEERLVARAWLPDVLTDAEKFDEHIALLCELYHGAFQPQASRRDRLPGETSPQPRATTFTHFALLPEERARLVAEEGCDLLSDDETAALLLNPFALWDLADLIDATLSDWWIDRLAEAGRAIIAHHDLVIHLPEPPCQRPVPQLLATTRGLGTVERRGQALVIGFTNDARALKQRIAQQFYGDPERNFTLTLHPRPAAGTYILELEVSPAPVRENLTLSIDLNGQVRSFTLAVPPSVRLDPEADPPERVFARAAEPVPEAALQLQQQAEWRDDAWPPFLILRAPRCRVGNLGRIGSSSSCSV